MNQINIFDTEDSINEAAYEIDWSELFNSASAIPHERYQLLSEGRVEIQRLESYLANELVQQLLKDYENAYVREKTARKRYGHDEGEDGRAGVKSQPSATT